MSYEEFVASIQEAVAAKVSAGNVFFGIILLIAIITGLVFFFLYGFFTGVYSGSSFLGLVSY